MGLGLATCRCRCLLLQPARQWLRVWFVATAAGATVIHTTLCHHRLDRPRPVTGGWTPAYSRTDGRESTRAEQMKNGLVPRWLFHWLRASSGIAARQIVVMATRRRRLPASLMLVVLTNVHDESTFSSVAAHNFDLKQTNESRRHDRMRCLQRDTTNPRPKLTEAKRTAVHQP